MLKACRCNNVDIYRIKNGEITYFCKDCKDLISQKDYNKMNMVNKILNIFKFKPSKR